MTVESWIIGGVIVGGLVGLVIGRKQGVAVQIILGIIGGLLGGPLASILFVVSGAVNHDNIIFAIIAYVGAAILLVLKHMITRTGEAST